MVGTVEKGSKLTIGQHFAAGAATGIVESLTCHPLDTIKVTMQVNIATKRLNPVSAFRLIMRRDGLLGFYRGLGAVAIGITPKMAFRFSSFEAAKKYLFPSLNTTKRNLLSGMVAGATETLTAVNPTEVVKIRLQTDPSLKHVGHALATIIKEEGFKGFYRGATLTVTRQAINQAVNFTVYHEVKSRLQKDDEVLPSYKHFMIGAFSGSIAPISNAPIDTLKTRVQSMRNHQRRISFTALARQIYEREGFLAFYKGITPRLIRMAPGQAVTFTVYEKVSQWMQKS